MLTNYIRIQFLRYFKGRTFTIQMLLTLFFELIMIMFGYFMHYLLINNRFELVIASQDVSAFFIPKLVFMGCTVVFLPILVGVITICYVSNYYQYRTHINLEIKLQNRVSFAFSEIIFLAVMCIVEFLAALLIGMIAFAIEPNSIVEGINEFSMDVLYKLLIIPISMFNNAVYAYFLTKLFRRKLFPMIIYLFSYWISTQTLRVPLIRALIGLVYIPDDGDTFYVLAIIIRISLMIVGGILLFHRRYEERVV